MTRQSGTATGCRPRQWPWAPRGTGAAAPRASTPASPPPGPSPPRPRRRRLRRRGAAWRRSCRRSGTPPPPPAPGRAPCRRRRRQRPFAPPRSSLQSLRHPASLGLSPSLSREREREGDSRILGVRVRVGREPRNKNSLTQMAAPAIPRINDVESSKENCGEVRRKRAGEAATATLADRWARLCQAPGRGAGMEASWWMGRVNGTPSLELWHLVVIKAQWPARLRLAFSRSPLSFFFSFRKSWPLTLVVSVSWFTYSRWFCKWSSTHSYEKQTAF